MGAPPSNCRLNNAAARLFGQSPRRGAVPLIHACAAPELDGEMLTVPGMPVCACQRHALLVQAVQLRTDFVVSISLSLSMIGLRPHRHLHLLSM